MMMINLHFQWHLHELHCNDDDDESTWIPVKEFQFPSRGFFCKRKCYNSMRSKFPHVADIFIDFYQDIKNMLKKIS